LWGNLALALFEALRSLRYHITESWRCKVLAYYSTLLPQGSTMTNFLSIHSMLMSIEPIVPSRLLGLTSSNPRFSLSPAFSFYSGEAQSISNFRPASCRTAPYIPVISPLGPMCFCTAAKCESAISTSCIFVPAASARLSACRASFRARSTPNNG